MIGFEATFTWTIKGMTQGPLLQDSIALSAQGKLPSFTVHWAPPAAPPKFIYHHSPGQVSCH